MLYISLNIHQPFIYISLKLILLQFVVYVKHINRIIIDKHIIISIRIYHYERLSYISKLLWNMLD